MNNPESKRFHSKRKCSHSLCHWFDSFLAMTCQTSAMLFIVTHVSLFCLSMCPKSNSPVWIREDADSVFCSLYFSHTCPVWILLRQCQFYEDMCAMFRFVFFFFFGGSKCNEKEVHLCAILALSLKRQWAAVEHGADLKQLAARTGEAQLISVAVLRNVSW